MKCFEFFRVKTIKYFLFFLFIIFFTSCELDDNEDPNEGREIFIGAWTCQEASQLPPYTVHIIASNIKNDEVFLRNFHMLGDSEQAIASVSGDAIVISNQSLCSGEWSVEGNGLMTSNKKDIIFRYTVSDGFTIDTINATYTKQ